MAAPQNGLGRNKARMLSTISPTFKFNRKAEPILAPARTQAAITKKFIAI